MSNESSNLPDVVNDGGKPDDESSDDEGGWITPSNISNRKHLEAGGDGSGKETSDLKVACITNDFAMQV